MRNLSILLFSVAWAGPALAEKPASVPSGTETAQVQRALTDPAITERLTRALPALGDALLNMPVGELQAALEGRPATAADKRTTVRDLGRRDDPDFERELRADLANGGETMRAGMHAMSAALPALMEGMRKAAQEMEKATANLPSPTYPKR